MEAQQAEQQQAEPAQVPTPVEIMVEALQRIAGMTPGMMRRGKEFAGYNFQLAAREALSNAAMSAQYHRVAAAAKKD